MMTARPFLSPRSWLLALMLLTLAVFLAAGGALTVQAQDPEDRTWKTGPGGARGYEPANVQVTPGDGQLTVTWTVTSRPGSEDDDILHALRWSQEPGVWANPQEIVEQSDNEQHEQALRKEGILLDGGVATYTITGLKNRAPTGVHLRSVINNQGITGERAPLSSQWVVVKGKSTTPIADEVTFSAAGYTVAEGETASLGLTRYGATDASLDSPLAVALATANGTAVASDYTGFSSRQVTMAAESATASSGVATTDDDLVEEDETLTVTMSVAENTGFKVTDPSTTTVTITDDDRAEAKIAFGNDAAATAAHTVTVAENVSGGTLNVPVTISHLPGESTTFMVYAVQDYAELIADVKVWRNDPQWVNNKTHTDRWDRVLLAFGETLADASRTRTVQDYAGLIADVKVWRNDPQWVNHKAHTDRWDRVLLAFGETVPDASLTPMTAAEAQELASQGHNRWVRVAEALGVLEAALTPMTAAEALALAAGGDDHWKRVAPALAQRNAQQMEFAAQGITGTAMENFDYTIADRSVTFGPTDTGKTKNVAVAIIDDAEYENDETIELFIVAADSPVNDLGDYYARDAAGARATVTIDSEDQRSATKTYRIHSTVTAYEGLNAVLHLTLFERPASPLTFKVVATYDTPAPGKALAGDANGFRESTVTVPAGQNRAEIRIPIAKEGWVEPDETFTVTVTTDDIRWAVADNNTNTATVTIKDNDAATARVVFGSDPSATTKYTASVGEELQSLRIPVTVNAISSTHITFTVEALGTGTAQAGRDYALGNKTVNFNHSSESHVQINIYDDARLEDNETIELRIAPADDPVNDQGDLYARDAAATATITLIDDDTHGVIVSDESLTAGFGKPAAYTVVLSVEPTDDVTVTPASDNPQRATVSAPVTFTPENWNVPQQITVTGVADADTGVGAVTVSHQASSDDDNYGSDLEYIASVRVEFSSKDYTLAPADAAFMRTIFMGAVSEQYAELITEVKEWRNRTRWVNNKTHTDKWDRVLMALGEKVADASLTPMTLGEARALAVQERQAPWAKVIQALTELEAATPNLQGNAPAEGKNAELVITLRERAPQGGLVFSVAYDYAGSAATAADLNSPPTTVTVAEGSTTARLSIPIARDLLLEGDETFTVTIATDAAGWSKEVGGADTATVTITDLNREVSFAATTYDVAEGVPSGKVTTTLNLNKPHSDTITATVSFTDVEAERGADYGDASATAQVVFAPGQTSRTLDVAITDDDLSEGSESFTLTITAVSAGHVIAGSGAATTTVTIADDDTGGVTVTPTTLSVTEHGTSAYTIALDSEPTADVTITPASSAADHATVSGALTFTPTNWSQPQEITVAGVAAGGSTISHQAVSDDAYYGSLTPASVAVTVKAYPKSYTLALDVAPTGTEKYAALITEVKEWRNDPVRRDDWEIAERWDSALLALGETVANKSLSPMTLGEAQSHAAAFGATPLWRKVVRALHEMAAALGQSDIQVAVAEGGTVDLYVALRNSAPQGGLEFSVTYDYSAGAATAADLNSPPATVTVAAGGTNARLSVPIARDDQAEGDETFTVVIATDAASWKRKLDGTATATVTIADDDTGGVTVTPTTLSVTEGGASAYTVVLDSEPTANVTITPASSAADHATVSDALTFTTTNWNRPQKVTVDGVKAGSSTISHQVVSSDGDYGSLTPESVAVTVKAYPKSYTLAADATSAVSAQYAALVTKVREWRNDPQWVNNKAHTDRWDRVLLALGETVADASLSPMSAAEAQALANQGHNRWVEVAQALAALEAARLAAFDALSQSDIQVTVTEGGTVDLYVALLERAPQGGLEFSVSYDYSAGAAVAADLNSPPATVTVAAGSRSARLSIPIARDALAEGEETFTVAIATDAAGWKQKVGGAETATVTISAVGVTVTPTTLSVTEHGASAYTVALGSKPTADVIITPVSSAADHATVSDALTFTPTNWNQPQEVTVTGVQAGGSTISHQVVSSDSDYGPLTPDPVAVAVSAYPTSYTLAAGTGEQHAALITQVKERRNDSRWVNNKTHTDKWDRVLLALGETVADASLTPMYAAEARALAGQETNALWTKVAQALSEDVQVTATEGGTVDLYVALRQSAPQGGLEFSVAYGYSGAATAADLNSPPATLTVAEGSKTATLSIPIAADGLAEQDETLTVTVATDAAGWKQKVGGAATATVTIKDVTFSATKTYTMDSAATAGEGGNAELTVTLGENAPTGGLEFDVSYGNGRTAPNTLTVPAGSKTATLSIPIAQDRKVDNGRAFTVTIATSALGWAPAADGADTATVTVTDTTETVSFARSTYSVIEGRTANLVVTRTGATANSAVVEVTTYAYGFRDFASDSDLTSFDGQVIIPDGSATVTVAIETLEDTQAENAEYIYVTLKAVSPGYATGAHRSLYVYIQDDDTAPYTKTYTITGAVTAGEGGNADLIVNLGENAPEGGLEFSVSYDYSGSTATEADTGATPSTLTVAAGSKTATLSIPIAADEAQDEGEYFTVTIAPNNHATEWAPSADGADVATVVTSDAQQAQRQVIVKTYAIASAVTAKEGENAQLAVTLNRQAPEGGLEFSVAYDYSGSAATSADTGATPSTLTVAAGSDTATLTVPITADAAQDGGETFTVTITPAAGVEGWTADPDGTDTATVTITDVAPPNRAPTVSAAIADATIVNESGTKEASLSGVFSDADNDALTITAASSDDAVATVSVATDQSKLTVSAQSRGTATITVTANDGNGGTVDDAFTVTVKAAPLVASAISDVSGLDAGATQDVSLSGLFSDADNDALTITAASSDDAVATVSVAADQSSLTVAGVAEGTATITVTAQDADGNRASDAFDVSVVPAVPGPVVGLTIEVSEEADSITVSWQAPVEGGAPTGYIAHARPKSGAEGSGKTREPRADKLSVTFPNLQAGLIYEVWVRGRNDSGKGERVHAEITLPPAPAEAPGPVVGLQLSATADSITATWQAPATGGVPARYIAHVRPKGGEAGSGKTKYLKFKKLTVTFPRLEAGETYRVWVRGQNGVGKGERVRAEITLPEQ